MVCPDYDLGPFPFGNKPYLCRTVVRYERETGQRQNHGNEAEEAAAAAGGEAHDGAAGEHGKRREQRQGVRHRPCGPGAAVPGDGDLADPRAGRELLVVRIEQHRPTGAE